MQDNVIIAVLSAVEPPLPECMKAVEAQLGGPYRVVHVRDVVPMYRAFNEMIRRSAPSKYVVQVDGDVVLERYAVEALRYAMESHPLTYMCWGQLYEEGFGPGGSVRIWRRWPLRLFKFRDRRCVDRDLHARVRWTGLRRFQVPFGKPVGTHYPRQSEFSRFSKAKNDAAKWVYLKRQDLIRKHLWNAGEPFSPEMVGADIGLALHTEELNCSKNAAKDYDQFMRLKHQGVIR